MWRGDLILDYYNVSVDDMTCPCCGGKVVKEGGIFKCATTGTIVDPHDATPSEMV